MTSPESFVSRWARLKRSCDIQRGTESAVVAPAETSPAGVEAAMTQPEIAAAADVPFDPASLPSIEDPCHETGAIPFSRLSDA